MGSLFGSKATADGGDRQRQPHRPYRYLVTRGWSQEWVHCPLCRSKNAGWSGSTPRYTGGVVQVVIPLSANSYQTRAVNVACHCADGQAVEKSTGMRSVTAYTPQDLDEPEAVVLWDMQAAGRKPRPGEVPPPLDAATEREYVRRIGEQVARFAKGEITGQELRDAEQRLRNSILPAPIQARGAGGR